MEKSDIPYGRIWAVSDLGKVIRVKRKAAGLRQIDLAEKARVGARFISDLENGKETIELGRTLHVLSILEMELYIRPKKYLTVIEGGGIEE